MTTPEQLGQAEQVDQASQWVWLARIRRPQGRKGEVFADILTDFPEKFAERHRLWLLPEAKAEKPVPAKGSGHSPQLSPTKSAHAFSPAPGAAAAYPREVDLLAHWAHKGGLVLHFAGVESISAAEALNGLIVAIPMAERAPLHDDEVYIADLIGCTLYDVAKMDAGSAAPVPVGPIEDVDRTAGPVALLVVRGASGEILIPFAKSYLRSLDLAAKRVEMSLPEGLTDLNAPQRP